MGGIGSGNFWRWASRDTCESYTRIELPYLRKRGMLRPGYFGSLSWKRGGEPSGNIRFQMHESSMEVRYRYRKTGQAEWQAVREHIPFAFTPQHLGGQRRWFVCLSCRRRCTVLYGGTHYRCRKCWNLAYQSQHEEPHDRALSQAQKLRQRLGGSPFTDEPFPEKPKGMHWRTYEKLKAKGEALDERSERAALARLGRLLGSDF